ENGQLALKNASADTVKSFAHMMITDHSSVNEKARALAGRLKLTPRPSAASRGLVKQMNAKRVALGELSGGDFDKAYLDNEIAYHQSVLDLLDGKLIPSAKNAELKDLLTSVRPAFQAHLDHA